VDPSTLEWQKFSHHLGLSEYEARVYVSLVMEGASEARKLSLRCGVPRTKVYATLKKLLERGLVFELPVDPRKFAPMSPAEAFEPHLLHFKEKTSESVISLVELGGAVSFLEEAYKKAEFTMEPKKEEVWILEGQSEILGKIREMLARAEKKVTVLTTESGFVFFYKAFDKLLDKLSENGVKIQIGTSINSHNGSLVRELNYVCKVEHVDIGSPLLYLCVDDEISLLAKFNPSNESLESEKNHGVFCTSSTLCELFSLLLPKLAPATIKG
jgi:sugar-specific transcriptional regulator TrmB